MNVITKKNEKSFSKAFDNTAVGSSEELSAMRSPIRMNNFPDFLVFPCGMTHLHFEGLSNPIFIRRIDQMILSVVPVVFRLSLAVRIFALVLLVASPFNRVSAEGMPGGDQGKSQVVALTDERLEPIRQMISGAVESGELPTVAVAVSVKGEVIWEEAFGWADREQKQKATPHTIYPLASLSKSITATGIMLLVEEGQIDLDRSVSDYLGGANLAVHMGQASDIKVRNILNMTAGIPHGSKTFDDNASVRPLSSAQFLERHCFSAFPPGKSHHYSNISMAVADQMIETVSGESVAHYMQTKLFNPLGMMRTSAHIGPERIKSAATKYGADGTPLPHSYFQPLGGGGYYSSAHDLLLYGMFHLKRRHAESKPILKDETLDEMHRSLPDLPGALFALGWGSVDLGDGLRWLVSNGGIDGACTMLSLLEGEEIAIVILTNITSESRVADEMAVHIMDALSPGFMERYQTIRAEVERAGGTPGEFTPDQDLTGTWEGKVASFGETMGIRFVIKDDGDVHIEPENQLACLGNNITFHEGRLSGIYVGWIATDHPMAGDNMIEFDLLVDGDQMTGFVRPTFDWGQGTYSLPAYCSLQKMVEQVGVR